MEQNQKYVTSVHNDNSMTRLSFSMWNTKCSPWSAQK